MQYLYENDQTSEFYKVVIIIYTITAVLPGIPINAISVRCFTLTLTLTSTSTDPNPNPIPNKGLKLSTVWL